MKQFYSFLLFLLSVLNGWAQNVNFDLSLENDAEDWVVTDQNNDGLSWEWSSELAGFAYRGDLAVGGADDLLYSPSFQLNEGQLYYVSYEFEQRGAFDADMVDVLIPSADNGIILCSEIISYASGNGTFTKTLCFRGDAMIPSNAQICFHIKTLDANGSLTLKKMSIQSVDAQTPGVCTEITAVMENGSLKLNWTAPSTDTNGVALIDNVDFLVTINGDAVGTLMNQEPAAACEFVFEAVGYSGEVVLGVQAAIGDVYGEIASINFNLQDVQGKEELFGTYLCNSSEGVSKWKIYDNSGAGKMVYDLGTIWLQHKLGKAYEEDDWAISPSFKLTANERYFVRYGVATKRDYGATFDVTVGKGTTVAAQMQVLDHQELLMQNGEGEFDTKQFSVDTTGNYNVGFHVTYVQNDFSLYYVSVYHIVVIDGIETAVEVPASSQIFSLDGRRLSHPTNGIYILNGTKIMK